MSPIEQMKRYIRDNIEEYTKEFVSFVDNTVTSFNKFYPNEPYPITVISVLYFNTQEMRYERGAISSREGYSSNLEMAKQVGHEVLGESHPKYCVGYCIAASGFVSKYNVQSPEERKEAMEMANALDGDDPLSKEMLIYTIVSVLGVKKMDFFEVVRGEDEDKNVTIVPHTFKGLSEKHVVEGPLANIFETTELAYNDLVKTGVDISSYIKKNIFE